MKKFTLRFTPILFSALSILFISLSFNSNSQPVMADSSPVTAKPLTTSNVGGAFNQSAVMAATITVRSNADAGGTCPGANCTLRQAIATATPGDTIDFDMTSMTSPITLSSELTIDKNLTIQGPGASLLTISGNNTVRVFNIGGLTAAINVTINGLTIANGRHRGNDGNPGTDGLGGGILNDSTGTLSINNAVLTANLAIGGDSSGDDALAGQGLGGAIYNRSTGTVNITNGTLSGNSAKGGSFVASNSLGDGGAGGGGIFNINGTVNLTYSTLSDNSTTRGDTAFGGPSTPTTRLFTGTNGGGILNFGAGIINIINSTVSGNSADGGTIRFTAGQGGFVVGSFGGGIYNHDTAGIVMVTNSTFFGNSVRGANIVTLGGDRVVGLNSNGGGIFNAGQLTVTNSTFSGNLAVGVMGVNGGASGTGDGGGIDNGFVPGSTVTVKDTIIAGNIADIGPDFKGTLISQGYNLIGNNKDATITPAPGTADQIGTPGMPVDPLLAPLADNGGMTQTMALLNNSPAIDKGAAATDPISGLPITTDQRGLPRPVDNPAIPGATGGNNSDIGAFEAGCTTICSPNQMVNTGPGAMQCGAVVIYPAPTTTGNCGAASCSPTSGSFFPVGTTTITCSTQTGPSCSFTITVFDNTPPNLTCPANMNVGIPPGQKCATVTFAIPTANDNCPGATVICTPGSGTCFPTGTTTVTCTATDASKNTANCSFTVTVTQQICTITCPANITKSNDSGQCGAVVSYSAPTTSAACGTVTCSPASGAFFPKGTTTITCTTTSGPSCTFTVSISDTQAPMITCPANRTAVIPNQNSSCVMVNYSAPVVSDNCPSVGVVCSPASGTCFPSGVTIINCTATDTSANTANCSFTVSVFNVCLQDDSNTGMVLLFNISTGDYRYCCGSTSFTGRGTVTKKAAPGICNTLPVSVASKPLMMGASIAVMLPCNRQAAPCDVLSVTETAGITPVPVQLINAVTTETFCGWQQTYGLIGSHRQSINKRTLRKNNHLYGNPQRFLD